MCSNIFNVSASLHYSTAACDNQCKALVHVLDEINLFTTVIQFRTIEWLRSPPQGMVSKISLRTDIPPMKGLVGDLQSPVWRPRKARSRFWSKSRCEVAWATAKIVIQRLITAGKGKPAGKRGIVFDAAHRHSLLFNTVEDIIAIHCSDAITFGISQKVVASRGFDIGICSSSRRSRSSESKKGKGSFSSNPVRPGYTKPCNTPPTVTGLL